MTEKYYVSFFRPYMFAYLWWAIIVVAVVIAIQTIDAFIMSSLVGMFFLGLFIFGFTRLNPIKVTKDGFFVKSNSFFIKRETIRWDEIKQVETESFAFIEYMKISYKDINGTKTRLIPLSVHKKDEFIETMLKYIPNDENPLKAYLISERIKNSGVAYENGISNEKISSFETGEQNKGPTGIGGVLIFVAVGRVIMPIILAITIIGIIQNLLIVLRQNTIIYIDLWKRLFLFELFESIIMFVASIILLVLFFGKKRAFKNAFIYQLLASCFLNIIRLFFVSALLSKIPELPGNPYRDVLLSMLIIFGWSVYIRTSVRVKNTFVR